MGGTRGAVIYAVFVSIIGTGLFKAGVTTLGLPFPWFVFLFVAVSASAVLTMQEIQKEMHEREAV